MKIHLNKKEKGQTMLIIAILFSAIAVTITFGLTSPMVRQFKIVSDLETSKKSYFVAEAGAEDAYYRIKNILPASFPSVISLDGATASISVSTIGSNEQEILSEGNLNDHIRTVVKDITVTDGFSFNFAVQVGIGGLELQNNSSVVGNVYSSGQIRSVNSGTRIYGDIVSSGPNGIINAVNATGTAYAHEIKGGSKICGDAYYQVIDSTSLNFLNNPTTGASSPCTNPLSPGTAHPNSLDRPDVPMPIPDSLLDQWESQASAGGTINTPCPYQITSGTVTLGPIKIDCNVVVSGNGTTVILAGAVWINGNLTVNNSPKFKLADSVGNKSVPLITRSVSNPTGSGRIILNNNPEFYGSETGGVANPDSYVMFISRNTSNSTGGSVIAASAGNNVTGNLLLYAPYGEIELSNNVLLREVTSYKLTLRNNTQVRYNVGLAQPLFTSGPGGQWKIKRWGEI